MITKDFEIWQINYFSNLHGVSLATFEYDWYTSKKPVLFVSNIYGNMIFDCRMKYLHEYYQRFDVPMAQNTIISNERGHIKVKSE